MEDVKKLIEEIGTLNKEFQDRANRELAEVKAKQSTAITQAELDKVAARLEALDEQKARMDSMDKKLAKLEAFGEGVLDSGGVKEEHRGEFMAYVRKNIESPRLRALDAERGADRVWDSLSAKEREIYAAHKSLSVAVSASGGFLVPETIEAQIYDIVREENVMRGVCDIVTVTSDDYKQNVNAHGATAEWRGESTTVNETNTPTLHQISAVMGELSAMPITTQKALDDINTDVQAWLAKEVGIAFAEAENDKFTDGNGIVSPKGFLDYSVATTADASRSFGTLQYVVSGHATAFLAPTASVSPADPFFTLIGETKPSIANGAIFMVNRATKTVMRKFKDADGRFIYQQGLLAGAPSTFLDYPVVENYSMPDLGADAYAVAFGNFKLGYRIVDRLGIRIIRDDLTTKGYVKFWTSKRVGGMVIDSNAIKLMKCST